MGRLRKSHLKKQMREAEARVSEQARERLEALGSMDEEKILAYCSKYQIPVGERETEAGKREFWGGVHKARYGLLELPPEERIRSKSWLIRNGFEKPVII